MIILGIDPGSRRIGYGIIRADRGRVDFEDAGILEVREKDERAALAEVHGALKKIFTQFRPELLAIERLFFVKNKKTGVLVLQTRGVILLSASEAGIPVQEYTPNEVKLGVTGYGLSDKKAVAKMVRAILREPHLDLIDDAMDALAVAIVAAQDRTRQKAGG